MTHTTADVYSAESEWRDLLDQCREGSTVVNVLGSSLTLDTDRKFGNLDNVQRYVNRVLLLPSVQDRWERSITPLKVRERRGATEAHYQPWNSTIAVPTLRQGSTWAMREAVILHEVSHHLSSPGVHHEAEFVGNFIDLVEIVMSPEHAFALRVCMMRQGVETPALV